MKKLRKLGQILLLMVILLTFNIRQVHAEGDLAVSVNAILPENQHNKDVTYYDLRMTPGQKQELELELSNSTDKDQKVNLEINNGTTNDSGVIDYSNRGKDSKRDDSLKIALSDIAKIPNEVLVKAKTKETVKIKLEMPENEFKGIVIGGIKVTEADDKNKKQDKSSEGMKIKNKIAYTIGLNLSESDKEMKAELDLLKAFADQTGGRNVVKANVQNNQPQILEDITYKAEVFEKGKKEVLHKSSAEGYRFAPNSNFNFDVSWESQPFKAGYYNMHMTAESKKTGQKWEWDKEFEITSTEAKKLNAKAIDLDKNNTLLYVVIGLSILLLIIISYVVIKKVLKKKEEKRRKELKKRKKQNGKKKKQSSKKKSK